MARTTQQPIRLADGEKRSVRTQFGALCYRVEGGKTKVLLISSRGSGRWVLPKGWPMEGKTPAETAETEAWEEAGATGKMHEVCLGIYSTVREAPGKDFLPCIVAIFPMKVKKLSKNFPEMDARKRTWVSLKKAAQLLDEPELIQIVSAFDPGGLG